MSSVIISLIDRSVKCLCVVQPMPKGDHVLNFSDAEDMINDKDLMFVIIRWCCLYHTHTHTNAVSFSVIISLAFFFSITPGWDMFPRKVPIWITCAGFFSFYTMPVTQPTVSGQWHDLKTLTPRLCSFCTCKAKVSLGTFTLSVLRAAHTCMDLSKHLTMLFSMMPRILLACLEFV